MKIIHVLKDGTVLDDITGHVVKMADCPELYKALDRSAAKHSEEEAKRRKPA